MAPSWMVMYVPLRQQQCDTRVGSLACVIVLLARAYQSCSDVYLYIGMCRLLLFFWCFMNEDDFGVL